MAAHKEVTSVEAEKVKAAGGLFILGTERHDSRRIDNQLRGRSGRQGDPGESRFFLALTDDVMRLYGSERLMNVFESLGVDEDTPIEHKMLTNALEQAQLAWQEKDGEKFKRYVNLGVLTSRAYDDLTIDLFAYDSTLTPQSKVMFEKFYILIKPQLAQGTEETILRRLTEGSWTLPEGADILKGRQLGID